MPAVPVVMLTSSREETRPGRELRARRQRLRRQAGRFHDFFEAIHDLGVFWAVLNEPFRRKPEAAMPACAEPSCARLLLLEDSDIDAELMLDGSSTRSLELRARARRSFAASSRRLLEEASAST